MVHEEPLSVVPAHAPVEPRPNGPLQDEIAVLAYSLWQARGCPEGTPDEDWFKAEEALRANVQISESLLQESSSTFFSQVTFQQTDISLTEINHNQTVESVGETPIDIERY